MRHRRVLVLVLCTGLAAGPALADVARVTAANANLRSAPGTASRVVATLSRGAALDVLETSGEWLKVRVVETKAEGWVHRTLVEVTPRAPAAPPPAAPPAAAPAAAAAATAPSAAVTIDHQDVSCIVAGQYPKLEACFRPEDSVGRGRVLFRGAGTEPWYYVDMTRDGPCYAALLPKPKPELKGMEYFVDVMDKAFVETIKPDKAPGQAFMPRVVKKQEDCDRDKKFALFLTKVAKPIVVGIARDPSGGILSSTAAKVLEGKAALAGFSSDGVVISSTGAAPGASAGSSTASGSAGGAGGGGIPTIAIVGGVLAAGALVAVAAGGGGGDSGSGGSGGSGSSSPGGSGGSGGTGGSGLSVAGNWTGNSGNGGGMTYAFSVEGASCTFHYDMGLNLTQSGSSVGGSMTYTGRTAMCNIPEALAQQIINQALAGFQDSGGFPVTGNASDTGSVTLNMGGLTFSGTYNRTNMDITSAGPSVPGATVQPMTIRVVRAP